MQTFLPYSNFARSAKVLDRQRLGKQRVEGLQLLDALTGKRDGWANHPAAKMWRGHERALLRYVEAMCAEWTSRGYDNTKCGERVELYRDELADTQMLFPSWIGNETFHLSHRRKLVWKNPDHYAELFGMKPISNEPVYVWPTP